MSGDREAVGMDEVEAKRRFAAARRASLATIRADGGPHLVPLVFAVDDERVYSAVDAKPKRSRSLARLANVRRDPRVSLLVDEYDERWERLWWVRADGVARVVVDGGERDRGLGLLIDKYAQYRERHAFGEVLVISVRQWRWWSAFP